MNQSQSKEDPRDTRIEELEQQLNALRKALVPRLLFPLEWKLSRGETSVLACLYSSPDGFRSYEMLRTCAEIFAEDTTQNLIGVRIFYLRQKLKPFGVKIYTRYAEGYFITTETRAIIKAALDKEAS